MNQSSVGAFPEPYVSSTIPFKPGIPKIADNTASLIPGNILIITTLFLALCTSNFLPLFLAKTILFSYLNEPQIRP
jgi:hypothetical protein